MINHTNIAVIRFLFPALGSYENNNPHACRTDQGCPQLNLKERAQAVRITVRNINPKLGVDDRSRGRSLEGQVYSPEVAGNNVAVAFTLTARGLAPARAKAPTRAQGCGG